MPKYESFSEDAEVVGYLLAGYKHAVNHEEFDAYFEKHIGEIDPEQWYPFQKLLDIFNDIDANPSSMMNFVDIGMAIAEHTPLPPEWDELPIEGVLQEYTAITALVNRGTDLGEIGYKIVDPRHVRLHYRFPVPDDYWYGVTYGFMRRFLPKGTPFKVYFDVGLPRREQGAEATIIHVTWESDYPQMQVATP